MYDFIIGEYKHNVPDPWVYPNHYYFLGLSSVLIVLVTVLIVNAETLKEGYLPIGDVEDLPIEDSKGVFIEGSVGFPIGDDDLIGDDTGSPIQNEESDESAEDNKL
jgi:hypothetical protein